MGVTKADIKDLIKTTITDCPLPSVVDILVAIGPDDGEVKTVFDFIKSHYTREQIRNGIEKYSNRTKQMNQLFGKL